jgi:hypothetical protein
MAPQAAALRDAKVNGPVFGAAHQIAPSIGSFSSTVRAIAAVPSIPFRKRIGSCNPDDARGHIVSGIAAWTCSAVTVCPDGATTLSTETRILCTDDRNRRRFRRYWAVVRPFSGLIRIELLRIVRREAEARSR